MEKAKTLTFDPNQNPIIDDKPTDKLIKKIESYCCPHCYLLPEILNFTEGNNMIKLKCKKHGEVEINIEDYFDKMKKWESGSELKTNKKCMNHLEEYIYYCKDCEQHLCKNCIQDSPEHDNHLKYMINNLRPNKTELSLFKEKINLCYQKKDELLRAIQKIEERISFYNLILNSFEKYTTNYLLNVNIKHIIYGDDFNIDEFKNASFKTLEKSEIFDDFIKNNFKNATKGLDKLDLVNKGIDNGFIKDLINGIEDKTIYNVLKTNNQIKEDEKIIELQDIKNLNLRGNNITSLYYFSGKNLLSLEILSLNENKINSIDNLKNLNSPMLKELYLSRNNINNIDVLSEVNFPNLSILWLSNNNIVSIDVLEKVNFKKLLKLCLSKNKIVDISVFSKNKAKFPQLYELYINDNDINPKTFSVLIESLFKKIKQFYY